MNILLVEDNRDLSTNLFDYFEARGHTMDLATDGIHGISLSSENTYDVIILDWMLPKMDGVAMCRHLRETGKQTPILMLTARDSLEDKIAGLEAGADDYVVKPFSLREVEARLLALIRRSQVFDNHKILQVGDLIFNTDTLNVLRDNRAIVLPPIALKFLEVLMRHSPRVLSREEVERAIWGDTPPDSDALRGHLHIMRNMVDKNSGKHLIKTHRGLGYQISDE